MFEVEKGWLMWCYEIYYLMIDRQNREKQWRAMHVIGLFVVETEVLRWRLCFRQFLKDFFFFAFSSDMEMNDQSYAWKWILCFGNCSLGVRCRRTCKDWDILLGCNCKSKMVWEIVCILVACFPTLCRCCDASGWRNKTARPVKRKTLMTLKDGHKSWCMCMSHAAARHNVILLQ